MVRTESQDGGRTWSEGTDSPLPNPNAAVEFLRLRSGRHLLVYNHSFTNRTPLTAALSSDGGRTFSRRLDLEAGPKGDYGYPTALQSRDGRIQVLYTSDERTVVRRIVLTEDELLGQATRPPEPAHGTAARVVDGAGDGTEGPGGGLDGWVQPLAHGGGQDHGIWAGGNWGRRGLGQRFGRGGGRFHGLEGSEGRQSDEAGLGQFGARRGLHQPDKALDRLRIADALDGPDQRGAGGRPAGRLRVATDQPLDRGRTSPPGEGFDDGLDEVDVVDPGQGDRQGLHVFLGGKPLEGLQQRRGVGRRPPLKTGPDQGVDGDGAAE